MRLFHGSATAFIRTILRAPFRRQQHPRQNDFPAGSLWFDPDELTLFFVKDIRLGRSHPGVVMIRRIDGRDRLSPSCLRDMDLRRITRVHDVPAPLQSPVVHRLVRSLFHDLHEMHAVTRPSALPHDPSTSSEQP